MKDSSYGSSARGNVKTFPWKSNKLDRMILRTKRLLLGSCFPKQKCPSSFEEWNSEGQSHLIVEADLADCCQLWAGPFQVSSLPTSIWALRKSLANCVEAGLKLAVAKKLELSRPPDESSTMKGEPSRVATRPSDLPPKLLLLLLPFFSHCRIRPIERLATLATPNGHTLAYQQAMPGIYIVALDGCWTLMVLIRPLSLFRTGM